MQTQTTNGNPLSAMYNPPIGTTMPEALLDMSILQQRPCIWGYGRASDADQCNTPTVQNAYVKALGATLQGTWGGFFCDFDVSGWKVPFARRPAARLLLDHMLPGDHLIIHKLDRISRNMKDTPRLMGWLSDNQINLYICDFGGSRVDLTSSVAKFMVNIMGSTSQFYSELMSERVREVALSMKTRGIPYCHRHRYGMHRVPSTGKRIWEFVYDAAAEAERTQIREWYHKHYVLRQDFRVLSRDAAARNLCDCDGTPWSGYSARGIIKTFRIDSAVKFLRRMITEGRGDSGWADFTITTRIRPYEERKKARRALGIAPSACAAALLVPTEALDD